MGKFLFMILVVYLLYKYVFQPAKLRSPPPQEPDIFIDHEEVKREHEKN
jgi:hypothetical protein